MPSHLGQADRVGSQSPTAPASLRDLWNRLNRAKDRLNDFRRVEAAFLGREPYSLSVKFNRHSRQYSLWFHVSERPPAELSLILSECVHEMRATLDNAIWAVANPKGGIDRDTAMPVCLEPTDWTNRGTQRRLHRIKNGSAVMCAIESLQPYKRTNAEWRRQFQPLYLLDELWNADKHRALLLTLGTTSKLRFDFNRRINIRWMTAKGFDKDGPICRVSAQGWLPSSESHLQYNYKPAFRVGFGSGGPYQNGIVVATNLSRLYKFVRYEAVPALRPFL